MMVFFAVAREGLESVFFLLAAFQQDVGIWPPLGARLGLATAVVLGFLLYWGGIRLNLGAFFKWTSLFILFVAAGLAGGAIRAFHEAGLWNHFQEIAFDMSEVLSTHSLFGTLMEVNLGAFFKWTSLFILFVAAGLAAGAIRAFHEAGLWNHFQEIAFDMSAVNSTHSLFGTLLEGIFGYQEAPSVSDVAVWVLYLIPALVAFVLPPRAGATASRSV